jgi:hypothetical protein
MRMDYVTRARLLIATVALLALASVAASVAPAQASAADTLQAAVTSPAPEQGIPLTIEFSGASEAVDNEGDGPRLFAVLRPAGGIGCQTNYGDDHSAAGGVSTELFANDFDYEGSPRVGPGPYKQPDTFNPPDVGSYLVCAWLETEKATLAGPVSTTFSTRGPQVLQLTVDLPHPALPGVAFQIDYTTHTDQQLAMYSDIRPTGGLPCAANHTLDGQQNQSNESNSYPFYNPFFFEDNQQVFGGPTTIAGTVTEAAGPYDICTWIEGPRENEVDATASTNIYVGTPPPKPTPRTVRAISPLLSLRSARVSRRHGAFLTGGAASSLTGHLRATVSCGHSTSKGEGRVIHGHFSVRLAAPRRCHVGAKARVTVSWPGSRAFLAQSTSDTVKVVR